MPVDPDELLIFKLRSNVPEKKTQQVEPAPVMAQPAKPQRKEMPTPAKQPPIKIQEEAIPVNDNPVPVSTLRIASRAKPVYKGEAIALAKGKQCFWHPWRNAYAVCSVCKRPFCYEDMIEYNNQVVCLEDMATRPSEYKREVNVKYGTMSIVSGVIFILCFLIFLYSARAEIIYIFSHAGQIGTAYGTSISSYLFPLIELFLTMLGAFSAIAIFVQTKSSYYLSSAIAITSVAIFCYHFINSGTIYLLAVGLLMFVAMTLLSLSKTTYASEITAVDYWENQRPDMEWSNVGVF